MAIPTLLILDRGDGKNFFGLPPLAKWHKRRKRSKTWMVLERREGWWTVVAIMNHKPTAVQAEQKLVREYV